MNARTWRPGDPLEVITSRYVLRSLRATDVGDDPPAWYGDAERRTHIWSPAMPIEKFLRGLAEAADNVRYFALLAETRETGEPIGLSKGQVVEEGGVTLFIVTTLLGDRAREGLMAGYEMTAGAIWFALNHLDVAEISMRIYEENETALSMVKHAGYKRHGSYEEKTGGGMRRVHDYRKTRDAWLAKNRNKFSHYVVRCGSD